MEKPHVEGVASRRGPESCVGAATNYLCLHDASAGLTQWADRSDGSLHATYGYGGPKGEAVTDPCLDPPETFDDCNPPWTSALSLPTPH